MASSQIKRFTCTHTCGCRYSTNRKNDLQRHTSTKARHRECTQDCPHHTVTVSFIDVETPEKFAAKQTKPRRKSTVPEATIDTLKVLCILDPTRRERSRKDTAGHASWFDVPNLASEAVEGVLGCKALKGYVFPVRGETGSIRIYDWVSIANPLSFRYSPLAWLNEGARDVLLPPRRGEAMQGGVFDLGGILRPARWKTVPRSRRFAAEAAD